MPNNKNQVDELVADLKQKIDNITAAADDVDEESRIKVEEIKNTAIKILSSASDKIVDCYKNISDSEEFEKSLDVVKNKSKELYDNALKKISEVKKSQTYSDTMDYVRKTANQVKGETIDFLEGTKNNIDEFFAKPAVKESIDKAKVKTVDVAEKALDTLKQWLKPEVDKKWKK